MIRIITHITILKSFCEL